MMFAKGQKAKLGNSKPCFSIKIQPDFIIDGIWEASGRICHSIKIENGEGE